MRAGSGRGWFVFPNGKSASGWVLRYRVTADPPTYRDSSVPTVAKGGPKIPTVIVPDDATKEERERVQAPARRVVEAWAAKLMQARKAALRRQARASGLTLEEAATIGAVDAKKPTSTHGEKASELTIRQLGKQWTSGDLAKRHPDQVREKRTRDQDERRLELHVYPHVGSVLVRDFTIEDGEAVMAKLDRDLSTASRRHVGQCLRRLFAMAVYPLRLIASNPLPPGFLPRVTKERVSEQLYPGELAQLVGCTKVPLSVRVLFGFLGCEGMRAGEAAGLRWRDLDLARGAVRLDENKTDRKSVV